MTNDNLIELARLEVLAHIHDEEFLRKLAATGKFNHTDDTGLDVMRKIIKFDGAIYLRSYRPWNPWTKAIAYASGESVYFNSRKSFPIPERVETIVHEMLHLLGYTHKGNYVNRYNLGTVPYSVAKMFKEYCNKKQSLLAS